MEKIYLAIDLGASSGRHIIGKIVDNEIVTEEIHRFRNGAINQDGHLVWDVENLFNEIKTGIKKAFVKYPKIESLAIDSWGVDYALIKDGKPVMPIYAYRDDRTLEPIKEVHKILDEKALFNITGISYQPFNTIYQLYSDKMMGRLDGVDTFLMIPEFLNYLLTGNIKKEFTMASTTCLVNAKSHEFDQEIIEKLGLPKNIFKSLYEGGETVGRLKDEIAKEVGGNLDVKLCLSHDTASAFYIASLIGSQGSAYISSGTWSLLGTHEKVLHNDPKSLECGFTNEGGINKLYRFLKNIMGMWIINNVCNEIGITPKDVAGLSETSAYSYTVDVNHEDFLAPKSMIETFRKHLELANAPAPNNDADIVRCAVCSLAKSYAESVKFMEEIIGREFSDIVIVGGGANNKLLNKLTEEYSGKKVIAKPIEATALGNLKIQMDN